MKHAITALLLFAACAPFGQVAAAQTVQNSAWDASVWQVEDWLDKNLKDPDSYESIEWSEVKRYDHPKHGFIYVVRHKYRAKNSFGGYVIDNDIFLLTPEGKVIGKMPFETFQKIMAGGG